MSRFSLSAHNDFLKGLSEYFDVHTQENGKNICAKHKIEHIGKTVYSIGIDLYLYEHFGDQTYFDRARKRALHISNFLIKTGEAYVFHPDGNDKWNMTNRVIDGGAITDMLAVFITRYGSQLPAHERVKIKEVIDKSADTYLVNASINKAPTNQRLWGATGLASAYLEQPKDSRKDALLKSIRRSFSDMRDDGSIPYITDYEGYEDASAKDVTTFYHSRHMVYSWYILESISEMNSENLEVLLKGTDFLKALYQADGLKNLELETKHWYFLSEYEVASHAYDACCFLKAYEYTNDEGYASYAAVALEKLYAHRVRTDGGIDDHVGGVHNFQCPYFWNANCAWLTRVAHVIKTLDGREFSLPTEVEYICGKSGIFNYKKEKFGTIIRANKAPRHITMGQRIGGGSMVYFGRVKNTFSDELLVRERPDHLIPGNFHFTSLRANPIEWFTISLTNLRKLLFHVRVELRAHDWRALYERIKIVFHESFSIAEHYSSAFATDVQFSFIEIEGIKILDAYLAVRDGSLKNSALLERSYRIHDDQVNVEEDLRGFDGNNIYYVLPDIATLISVKTNGSYTKNGNVLYFRGDLKNITISYSLVA